MAGVEAQLGEVSAAIGSKDWDRLASLLSDRFFGSEPGEGEPTAAARIVGLVADLGDAIPDLAVGFSDVGEGDDEAPAVIGITGTHEHPLWGSPGTGKAIRWESQVTVRAFPDGLAFRFDGTDVPSLLGALRQVGLVGAPEQMDQPPPYPVSIPEFLLKVVLTGQAADKPCGHLDQIAVTEPATRACSQCVAEGTIWPALRMCLTCGFVGCCDTSKNKHMLAHIEETGHPMMRSIRLDERWVWCYPDAALFEHTLLDRIEAG